MGGDGGWVRVGIVEVERRLDFGCVLEVVLRVFDNGLYVE